MILLLLLIPQLLMADLRLNEELYDAPALKAVPVQYQGRFRPLEVAAKIWWKDFYGKENYQGLSAYELLWRVHFMGREAFDGEPLFSVDHNTRVALGLPQRINRFSYNDLQEKNLTLLDSEHPLIEKIAQYQQFGRSPKPTEVAPEQLAAVLRGGPGDLRLLPGRHSLGDWISIDALNLSVIDTKNQELRKLPNPTLYTDEQFAAIRSLYDQLAVASQNPDRNPTDGAAMDLAHHLQQSYREVAGKPYRRSAEKMLTYPTERQLNTELWLYRLPLIEAAAVCYLLSVLIYLAHVRSDAPWIASGMLTLGFILHTIPLILRCYVLERPPVSNMFETVLYVPWITVMLGILLRQDTIRLAAGIGACSLLTLLSVTGLDRTMENVQAVLDSQYWLMVHVLMVVGSYGVFILAGVLGHIYLLQWKGVENEVLNRLGRALLTTMYIGVGLLIPGTILGGVWAAQSWGRFWDWDPKESWAFISACIYLIWIHAHTFGHIRHFGLAVGAVTGVMTVSFTWYGVNYVLGTGLHSYGFGSGNHLYYYGYLLTELLFLSYVWTRQRRIRSAVA